MGMTNGSSICSKHDKIKTLSGDISSTLEAFIWELKGQVGVEVIDSLRVLKTKADDIYDLAADAKKDGQSMENSLGYRKYNIRELEDQIEELEERVKELEKGLG